GARVEKCPSVELSRALRDLDPAADKNNRDSCCEAALSKTERRTNCNHPRVRPQASIAIENASARTDDVLHLRLQHPPRRQLRLVHHLDHGFPAAHRKEEASEESGVGIEAARIVADAGIRGGNADLVVRAQRYEAFVNEAAVGVEIDEITVLRNAARADESRQALVVAAGDAVEHLVDDTVDAVIAGVIEWNAGRLRIRERKPGIVEALIAEARAGVVPGSDPVRARKAFGVLALVGQIARLRDEKGAAAKAGNGAGGKRRRLIGAVTSAGIAAEHGRLKCPLIRGLDADANAGSGQRIGRASGRKIGGEKRRPADRVVDEVRRRLALEKLAIRRHEAGANGEAVVEGVLLVPKRIEPSDRPGFEIRNRENIVEIRGTEKRPVGDEPVSVKFAALPSQKLLQVEVELRLKHSDRDGAR